MRDGMFILDFVVHMYDNSKANVVDPYMSNCILAAARGYSRPVDLPAPENDAWWAAIPVEEAGRLLFEDSQTDMAMAQTVPLMAGGWKDGFAPAERNYALAKRYPDKVLFCGGVDPITQGSDGALHELERQIVEWDAKSFKFYQAQGRGLHWSADDPRIAYPLYEACLRHGVKSVQFHKHLPFGHQKVEHFKPNDLQDAARDFPDMNFVIHHPSEPYLAETVNIMARYSNVWVVLSGLVNKYPFRMAQCQHVLGQLLSNAGPDRILYGSEAFGWPRVQGAVEVMADMQIPERMQDEYGYPEVTPEIRRKIFGENAARLQGIDIEGFLAMNTAPAASARTR